MIRPLLVVILALIPALAFGQSVIVSSSDVRNWFVGTSASCATDVSPAVNAAVAAGAKVVSIPAHCIYVPTGNITPADIEIVGEDWSTSILSVVNRATDFMSLGPRSVIKNMAVLSRFCDTVPSPVNTPKLCPVGEARNNSDSVNGLSNWVYQTLFTISGPQVTGPTGAVSSDIPQIACETLAVGADCHYIYTGAAGASGLRIVTGATGGEDHGIYLLNGSGDAVTTDHHYGIFLKDFTNSGAFGSFYFDRVGDGADVTTSVTLSDLDSLGSTNTRPFLAIGAGHQSGGSLFNIYGATTPFNGDAMIINLGNGGGAFTGNFVNFMTAGVPMFRVDSAGNVTVKGLDGLSRNVTPGSCTMTFTSGLLTGTTCP